MVQSYCANELRSNDYERYLSALFIPNHHREAVFTIYAFNSEVSRTREMVSESILGEIRLQWWRESIQKIYQNEIVEHPILESLRKTLGDYDLPIVFFEDLLDARLSDFKKTPSEDMEDLIDYARSTSGTLGMMVMKLLGFNDTVSIRVASLVSTAWALIGLIRAIHFHAKSERIYLPRELLIKKIVKKNLIILIGSSMGSWISLNQFKIFKKQIKGFLGIGSAPEFLENLMWKKFSKKMKKDIIKNGIISLKHGEYEYPITYKLIKDGRKNKVLKRYIYEKIKVTMIHGEKDRSVPPIYSKKILKIFKKAERKLVIIKNGDHSLSSKKRLKRLIKELSLIIN